MAIKDFDIEVLYGNEEVKKLSKSSLPDIYDLNYYNRLSRREIFLNNYVDDECVDYTYQIVQWNREDKDIPIEQRKKIKIFLHTSGGDVTAMNALISAIQLSKTPCMTIGLGKIFSAGAMLLLAAKERLLLSTSRVMIHKGSSGIISDVNKIIDYSKYLEKDNEACKQYILENTKITNKKYKEVEDKDWYLFPSECIDLGIATSIITDIDQII